MMPSSITYLHVETRRCALDVGGWHPEKMGVSVAVTLTSEGLRIFEEKDVAALIVMLQDAPCVVGYNLAGFDLRVLEGYRGSAEWRAKFLDLFHTIERSRGRRPGLASVCTATLGWDCANWGGSLERVSAWKRGELATVIEGAWNTVLGIRAVHEYGCEHGSVHTEVGDGGVAVDWAEAHVDLAADFSG